MATIVKGNSRKVNVTGPVGSIGFGDYARTGHLLNKHYSVQIGDHVIRFEPDEAVEVATKLLELCRQHGK